MMHLLRHRSVRSRYTLRMKWASRGLFGLDQARSLSMDRTISIGCEGKTDGGGAQVHAMMSAALFAWTFGLRYVYVRPQTIAHCPPGLKMSSWVDDWESMLGLHHWGEEPSVGPVYQYAGVFELWNALRKSQGGKRSLAAPHFHAFSDAFPELYEMHRQKFRSTATRLFEQPTVHYPGDRFIIAMHVRRGDVQTENPVSAFRFTPDWVIGENVRRLNHQYSSYDPLIRVFSQSGAEPLERYLPQNAELILDPDVFSTLRHLASADVLALGKSSLSFVAGVLAKGPVFFERFWHSNLPSWKKF